LAYVKDNFTIILLLPFLLLLC